jgi:hypothetical protein
MMPNRPPKKRISKLLCFVAAIVFLAVACQTPNGPRLPIPDQSLSVSVPEGLTRVIFLNTNYKSEGWGAGPIHIQLDGHQVPSLWAERYVQIFIEPGEYEVHIEQAGMVFWKDTYWIDVKGDELLVSVYRKSLGFSPVLEILDKLPSDFDSEFTPGRHPESW